MKIKYLIKGDALFYWNRFIILTISMLSNKYNFNINVVNLLMIPI